MVTSFTAEERISALDGLDGLGAGVRTDGSAADGYVRTADWLRRMYWTIPAPRLYPAVAAHSRLGTQLMRAADSPATRTRLGPAVAETAMLAGRIACFDLDAPVDAGSFYDHAIAAAVEVGDRPLAAAAASHRLFLPGVTPADLAAVRDDEGSSALQQAWQYAVRAEIATGFADHSGAQAALDAGSSALHAERPGPDPGLAGLLRRRPTGGLHRILPPGSRPARRGLSGAGSLFASVGAGGGQTARRDPGRPRRRPFTAG